MLTINVSVGKQAVIATYSMSVMANINLSCLNSFRTKGATPPRSCSFTIAKVSFADAYDSFLDWQQASNSGKVVASVFSQVSFKQMIDEVLANCVMSSLWGKHPSVLWNVSKWDYSGDEHYVFYITVDNKPTADKMSVNKSKATFEIEQC